MKIALSILAHHVSATNDEIKALKEKIKGDPSNALFACNLAGYEERLTELCKAYGTLAEPPKRSVKRVRRVAKPKPTETQSLRDPRKLGGKYRDGITGKIYKVVAQCHFGTPSMTAKWSDGRKEVCGAWNAKLDRIVA